MNTIQKAVDHFSEVKGHKLTVKITSANRCPDHNKAVGGASGSKHKDYIAADIIIPGVSPQALGHYLDSISNNKWGIGVYPLKGHVHLDMRSITARW